MTTMEAAFDKVGHWFSRKCKECEERGKNGWCEPKKKYVAKNDPACKEFGPKGER